MGKEKILKIIESATGHKMPPFLVGDLDKNLSDETPFISNIFIPDNGGIIKYPFHDNLEGFAFNYNKIKKSLNAFEEARKLVDYDENKFRKGIYLDVYAYRKVLFKKLELDNFKDLKNKIEKIKVDNYKIKIKRNFENGYFAGLSLDLHKTKGLLYSFLFLEPFKSINPRCLREHKVLEKNLLKDLIEYREEIFERSESKIVLKNKGNLEKVLEVINRHKSIFDYSTDETGDNFSFGAEYNKVQEARKYFMQFTPQKFRRFYDLVKDFEK